MTTRIDKKLHVNDALSQIIGKTISSIVVAHHEDGHPRSRMYFVFSDGTAFELWTEEEDLSIASGLENGNADQLADMLSRRPKALVCRVVPNHDDPTARQADLYTNKE